MPRHNLALAPSVHPDAPAPPEEALTASVSATSVSFIGCGAAVADLGALLRDLRLALLVAPRAPAGPEQDRAAALLAARLESVRGALDGATAAIGALFGDSGRPVAANVRRR